MVIRDRYDPSTKVGMPAHVTLLYPFKSPDEIDGLVFDTLRRCLLVFRRSSFLLGRSINLLVKPYIWSPSRKTRSEN